MADFESIPVQFEAAWLLETPLRADERTILILTMQGYASNPEAMLRLTAASAPADEFATLKTKALVAL